jgi:hypothetical protein
MPFLVMLLISIILGTFMAHVTTSRHKWPDYIGYIHWIQGTIAGPTISDLYHIPDYYLIRELEYKLFGENFHHVGSPIPCNCMICNPPPMCVNSQLCTRPGTHNIREHIPEWDRKRPRNREPISLDRTVYVPKGTKFRKIPLSRDPHNFDPIQRIIAAAYSYGRYDATGRDTWQDRNGE